MLAGRDLVPGIALKYKSITVESLEVNESHGGNGGVGMVGLQGVDYVEARLSASPTNSISSSTVWVQSGGSPGFGRKASRKGSLAE